ncbi:MAG: dihydrofolate reductase family protein [Actinomycetia bacterium]|nr:dihydrofolate reductase family protein [Actinomycetes bacterium]
MFLTEPDDDALRALYAVPPVVNGASRPFVRANFVMTADGHVTGPDGVSGSINNPADKRVFDLLRSLADTVLVGAGTVRAEGYERVETPGGSRAPSIVVVSNRGIMPTSVVDSPTHDGGIPRGPAFLATSRSAPQAQAGVARIICGESSVDEEALLRELHERGARSVLCEGGPHLLTSLLERGLIDELAITTSPMLVGAVSRLQLTTSPLDVSLSWAGGAVIDGTLFALWRVADRA